MPAGPFSGLLVLDLTRVLAGPFCTMMLAELGARVIKVENPDGGDDSRSFDPFVNGQSAYFASLNRGKESIALNLKDPADRTVFLTLVRRGDVLVENFRPGTLERLQLGYEQLREVNPRLIYAAVSGFGHSGPWSHKPAYDMIVQALGGLMSVTGHPGGRRPRPARPSATSPAGCSPWPALPARCTTARRPAAA
jgi:CoA:oxalate CoA-transferase